MCGRFALETTSADLTHNLNLKFKVKVEPRHNKAPSQPVLIHSGTKANTLSAVRRYQIPHWAEDEKIGCKLIKARSKGLYRELKTIYPDEKDFAASTATAKINGYLGCNGDPAKLAEEMSGFGLSLPMQQRLLAYVSISREGFTGLTCPVPQ